MIYYIVSSKNTNVFAIIRVSDTELLKHNIFFDKLQILATYNNFRISLILNYLEKAKSSIWSTLSISSEVHGLGIPFQHAVEQIKQQKRKRKKKLQALR